MNEYTVTELLIAAMGTAQRWTETVVNKVHRGADDLAVSDAEDLYLYLADVVTALQDDDVKAGYSALHRMQVREREIDF